jgi:hypothetical protein
MGFSLFGKFGSFFRNIGNVVKHVASKIVEPVKAVAENVLGLG